jgi:hypothetical protein
MAKASRRSVRLSSEALDLLKASPLYLAMNGHEPLDGRIRVLRALDQLAGHHPSHRDRLPALATTPPCTSVKGLFDAVVVPTSRPFAETEQGLGVAIDTASRFGARLLVLCSGAARAEEFPFRLLSGRPAPVAVMDVGNAAAAPLPLPRFETRTHPFCTRAGAAHRDVADKRNLALLLAVAHDWRGVLFLDDDVRTLPDQSPDSTFGPATVHRAFETIYSGRRDAVAWTMTDFPDNSAFCHSRLLLGEEQEQFVGGGSLAVGIHRRLPFFPSIYNEDWLFLYPLLRRTSRQESRVAEAGSIGQAPYDPFAGARAASEEPGDVLAEGMFGVLGGGDLEDLIWHPKYWERVISRRKLMIHQLVVDLEELARRLPSVDGERSARAAAAAQSLRRVVDVHEEFDQQRRQVSLAERFVDYLASWGEDLQRWHRFLRRVEPAALQLFLKASSPRTSFWRCRNLEGFLRGETDHGMPPITRAITHRDVTHLAMSTAGVSATL